MVHPVLDRADALLQSSAVEDAEATAVYSAAMKSSPSSSSRKHVPRGKLARRRTSRATAVDDLLAVVQTAEKKDLEVNMHIYVIAVAYHCLSHKINAYVLASLKSHTGVPALSL